MKRMGCVIQREFASLMIIDAFHESLICTKALRRGECYGFWTWCKSGDGMEVGQDESSFGWR